jgi:alpha-tubulin suppressor-like RCC1 family protein
MNKGAISAVLAATAATVLVPTTLLQVTTAGAAGQAHQGPGPGQTNKTPGTVWEWGNSLWSNGMAPAMAPGLSGVVALADTQDMDDTGYGLRQDGTVWAWGSGQIGQLGNGATKAAIAPVEVHSLSDVVAVAAGGLDGYALRNNGTVWAWGAGQDGALGNGTSKGFADVPVQVDELSGVVAIGSGSTAGYAVRRDGTVWAWGSGQYGVLGNGTTKSFADIPVQVRGLSNVVAVSGGHDIALALRKDGTVWAWGSDLDGILGSGANGSESDVPVEVRNLSDVVAVALGGFGGVTGGAGYALRNNGTVWAWGNGSAGALGRGNTFIGISDVPAEVHALKDVVAIAGGNAVGIALLSDGTVRTWGENDLGELGVSTSVSQSGVPLQVDGIHGAVGVAGGFQGEYAIVEETH